MSCHLPSHERRVRGYYGVGSGLVQRLGGVPAQVFLVRVYARWVEWERYKGSPAGRWGPWELLSHSLFFSL